jgi:hypothetical protein
MKIVYKGFLVDRGLVLLLECIITAHGILVE